MTWIIKRGGHYRYLKSKDTLCAYSESQRDAIRFDKRWKATRALKWEAVWSSSWTARIVKLVPKAPCCDWEAEAKRLRTALVAVGSCGNCKTCNVVIRHVLSESALTKGSAR